MPYNGDTDPYYMDGDKYPPDPTQPFTTYIIDVYIAGGKEPSLEVSFNTALGDHAALRRAHYAAMRSLDWAVPTTDIDCRIASKTQDNSHTQQEEVTPNGN